MPPVPEFVTLTYAVPPVAISELKISASSPVTKSPVDMGRVMRAEPFHLTIVLEVKVAPASVNVKPPVPVSMLEGAILVISGTGALTLKPNELEGPPGLITVAVQLSGSVPSRGDMVMRLAVIVSGVLFS